MDLSSNSDDKAMKHKPNMSRIQQILVFFRLISLPEANLLIHIRKEKQKREIQLSLPLS